MPGPVFVISSIIAKKGGPVGAWAGARARRGKKDHATVSIEALYIVTSNPSKAKEGSAVELLGFFAGFLKDRLILQRLF